MKMNKKGGFTLLELLIVIAILAILSVALVIVLNPAETLKKARDAQRISDLSTLKTAIGLYMTTVPTPLLGGAATATTCQATTGTFAAGSKIFYSYPIGTPITDATLDGGTASVPALVQVTTPGLTTGSGWIPVNFGLISGGSPISNIPVDPINTIALPGSNIANTDLVYRYACSNSPVSFEIDATLESTAYTVDDNKYLSDGGNSNLYYETGTNLLILGKTAVGVDF